MTTDALTRVAPAPLAVAHERTIEDVLAQAEKILQAMRQAMEDGIHYGRIPGTPKPTLLKGGAEKLCLLFRLDPQYHSSETYDGAHLTVKSTCTLWHIPTGQRYGSGEGSCSTKESKYAYRRRGNDRIANPDLADQFNTVLKMSNKRALVAAVLNVTAASDVFTQDLEDLEPPAPPAAPKAPAPAISHTPAAMPPPADGPAPWEVIVNDYTERFQEAKTRDEAEAWRVQWLKVRHEIPAPGQVQVQAAVNAARQRLG